MIILLVVIVLYLPFAYISTFRIVLMYVRIPIRFPYFNTYESIYHVPDCEIQKGQLQFFLSIYNMLIDSKFFFPPALPTPRKKRQEKENRKQFTYTQVDVSIGAEVHFACLACGVRSVNDGREFHLHRRAAAATIRVDYFQSGLRCAKGTVRKDFSCNKTWRTRRGT